MKRAFAVVAVLVLVVIGVVAWLNVGGEEPLRPWTPQTASADVIARGNALLLAGNCMGCHTDQGGAPYAGGRPIDTPFGTVYTSNLTPDGDTGIGRWTPDEFWRALHHGRAKDGRLLYPAFPYPNYTIVTRDDADAMFHALRTLAPVNRPNRPHALRWPYDSQAALAVWRALFFRPAAFDVDRTQTAEWNRGAYLVRGLGHCSACHTTRNALGGASDMMDLSGGLIPMQNWYAPSLTSASEGGVADWDLPQIERLLRTGVAPRGTVLGPMAEVVMQSTQWLGDGDLHAMAVFLKSLPQTPAPPAEPPREATPRMRDLGAKLYADHCAQCHGDRGQGIAGAYPALAGNRAVRMHATSNLVQVVLFGGFPPATAGNPRPFGMPPYATTLSDEDVAAVLSHIRMSWGNRAGAVSELDVARERESAGS